jgi:hypothetical protein
MNSSMGQTIKPDKYDELALGESAAKPIIARNFWNDTGIRLISGQEYHFTAVGRWIDFYISCDADGFRSPNPLFFPWEPLRRMPHEQWFTLIGAIDRKPETQFRIGRERTMIAPATGTLSCFANDVGLAYWNNFGSLELTVRRTR